MQSSTTSDPGIPHGKVTKNTIKTTLGSGIQLFLTKKNLSIKCSLPWIIQEIRRLMHLINFFKNKTKKSGPGKDMCHFKRVKHLVQQKIKISYENYLADTLWVVSRDENEGSGFSPKKLLA